MTSQALKDHASTENCQRQLRSQISKLTYLINSAERIHFRSFTRAFFFFFFNFLSCRPSGVCLLTLNDLLAANADPNIADSAGRTALSWAVTNPSGKSPSNCCWREVMLTLAFQNRLIAVWQLAFQARDVLGTFEKQALEGTDSGQMGAYFQSRVNKKRQTGQNHGS